MAILNIPYTFTNGTTANATEVNAVIAAIKTFIENQLVQKDGAIKAPTIAIEDSAITSAKILDGTIVNADISDTASIALSKLATGSLPTAITVSSANIVAGTIVGSDIADLAITFDKIAHNTITLGKLASSLVNYLVPVGTISAYAGLTAPDGWLLCNGTTTSGYTALAALVGATTPDLRGHTLVGQSTFAPFNTNLLTKFGSTSDVAEHSHSTTIMYTPTGTTGIVAAGSGATLIRAVQATGSTSTQTVGSNATGSTYGNVQPSALVNYIIKY